MTAVYRQSGFTLIELLIVIAIVSILATVVTVSSSSARAAARDSQRKAELQNVSAALEVYRATNKHYPDVQNRTGSWATLKALIYPDYISQWPDDPKGDAAFVYEYVSNAISLGPVGAYFALDATLESPNERITAPQIVESGNAAAAVFLSGTFRSNTGLTTGKIKYRVAGH
ncbi:type II secretion system protein [Candidatus Berkelbacteria bacterium]|nr:type II secretion system protein [Candidatus Berkelbacteria bacterium]